MYDNENLYRNYTNKNSTKEAIIARMNQRASWLKQYNVNKKCKQKLIDCKILGIHND